MSFFNVKEKKVALLIATFFLMSFVYANESLSERAEELFLKKKRVEAIELLLSAAESVSNKNKSSYLALAKRMGSIFYQNKTQQYYEKGEFHLYKSPDIAAELFQAGLKIEPDNFKLLLGYARSQLYLKNGKAIFELITEKQWLLKIDSVFFRLAVSAAASEGSEKNLVKYIKEGKEVYKSQTFDQALLDMYAKGHISSQEAISNATTPNDLRMQLDFHDATVSKNSYKDDGSGEVKQDKDILKLKL